MKRTPLLLVLGLALLPLPARSGDPVNDVDKGIEKSLNDFEKWTKKNTKDFLDGVERTLQQLEIDLKKARDGADKNTNQALDGIEKDLKGLNKRTDEMKKEEKPDKEKAKKLDADVQKTSKELEEVKK